jgi:hypothetical protein
VITKKFANFEPPKPRNQKSVLKPMGDLLRQFMARSTISTEIRRADTLRNASEFFDVELPFYKGSIRPESVAGAILTVLCENGATAFAVQAKSAKLLEELKTRDPGTPVLRVVTKIGLMNAGE